MATSPNHNFLGEYVALCEQMQQAAVALGHIMVGIVWAYCQIAQSAVPKTTHLCTCRLSCHHSAWKCWHSHLCQWQVHSLGEPLSHHSALHISQRMLGCKTVSPTPMYTYPIALALLTCGPLLEAHALSAACVQRCHSLQCQLSKSPGHVALQSLAVSNVQVHTSAPF